MLLRLFGPRRSREINDIKVSLVNYASCAYKIAHHALRCDVRSRITRIIWVQSRITPQILGPSRVTQKSIATLENRQRRERRRNRAMR